MTGAVIDFVRAHGPVLVVLAPLAAMALAALTPSGRGAWAATTLGAAAMTFAAVVAVAHYDQRLSYALGGWAAPLGVELRIDGLSGYALVLVGLFATLGAGGGLGALRDQIDRNRQPLAAAAVSAALAGAAGLLVAGDLFVMFAALPLIWLSLGALTVIGADRDRRAAPAAFETVIAGAVGAGLFGFGAALVFMSTGAVDLDQVAGVLSAAEDTYSAAAGLALMAASLAMAACLAPAHAWAVGAFSRGPAWSAVALGAVLPAAGAIAAGRLVALAASALAPDLQEGLSLGLSLLGAAGALAASVQAMAARDFRRFIVYAGAAQAGCVAIGFAAASAGGVAGALFQLANQTAGLFVLHAAAAALRSADGAGAPMQALCGLGRRGPFLSLAISAALLTIVGAPMTAGFLSRWSLLQATFEARIWWGAAAIMLSSLASVVFAGRVLERMYLRPPAANARRPHAVYLAPGLIIAVAMIVTFGFNGVAPLRAAEAAAASLNWGGGR